MRYSPDEVDFGARSQTAAEYVALRHAGFDIIGPVAEFSVYYTYDSAWDYSWTGSMSREQWARYAGSSVHLPVLDFERSRDAASHRMIATTAKLAADGIVDLRVTRRTLAEGQFPRYEIRLTGTAVRALRRRHRPPVPFFSCGFDGVRFGQLVDAGWWPLRVTAEAAAFVRREDRWSRRQRRRRAGSEYTGYTALLTAVRNGVRERFDRAIRKERGNGLVLHALDVEVTREKSESGGHEHRAWAFGTGTVIRSHGRPRTRSPRPVLRLDDGPRWGAT